MSEKILEMELSQKVFFKENSNKRLALNFLVYTHRNRSGRMFNF